MSTHVAVLTYTHTLTYVTDKLLSGLQLIVRESGLNPGKIASDWKVLQAGISTWLRTRHLQKLVLEVFDPGTSALVGRWDFEINYDQAGDGTLSLDSAQIKYSIEKSGRWPSKCNYRIVADTLSGRPDVEGWSTTTLLSTDGFMQHSIGTTISGSDITTGTSYWKKTT